MEGAGWERGSSIYSLARQVKGWGSVQWEKALEETREDSGQELVRVLLLIN